MTRLEIKDRKKALIDHVQLILWKHPNSTARKEVLKALIDRLNHLDEDFNEQIPIDPDAEKYWKQLVDLLNTFFDANGAIIGKVSKGTLDSATRILNGINNIYREMEKESVFEAYT